MTHPRRAHIHEDRTMGERIADNVASTMGSWRFIIIQSAIVGLWITLNVWLLSHPFDPYPLILLNLLFSTQAAYAAPIIMMSQNRQAARDRVRDDTEAKEVDEMWQVNQQQLQILHNQDEMLTAIEALISEVKAGRKEEEAAKS